MPKRDICKTILGIDPGTRETGYAIITRHDLLDYGVKNFLNRNSKKEILTDARKWLNKIISYYRPEILAIETTNLTRLKNSEYLKALVREIEKIAKTNKIKVVKLAPNTIRKVLCGDGRLTKKDVAYSIVNSYYPELEKFINHGSKWHEDYWRNMFDAVAVALAFKKSLRVEKYK